MREEVSLKRQCMFTGHTVSHFLKMFCFFKNLKYWSNEYTDEKRLCSKYNGSPSQLDVKMFQDEIRECDGSHCAFYLILFLTGLAEDCRYLLIFNREFTDWCFFATLSRTWLCLFFSFFFSVHSSASGSFRVLSDCLVSRNHLCFFCSSFLRIVTIRCT